MKDTISYECINQKPIYIFESHHYALIPWCKLRQKLEQSPILISLDHHTDTHEPFLHECLKENPLKLTYDESKIKLLLDKIDFNNIESIKKVLDKLRNDEHIKTALKKDIVSKAFIISYDNIHDFPLSIEEDNKLKHAQEICFKRFLGEDTSEFEIERPFTYNQSDIYIPQIDGLNRAEEELYDLSIESNFLKEKFDIFNEMNSNIISQNHVINSKYILDIDLDYFHTFNSIQPNDTSFFYQLIKNAEIITIAQEKVFVELVRKDS